jgi:hypothetical protein
MDLVNRPQAQTSQATDTQTEREGNSNPGRVLDNRRSINHLDHPAELKRQSKSLPLVPPVEVTSPSAHSPAQAHIYGEITLCSIIRCDASPCQQEITLVKVMEQQLSSSCVAGGRSVSTMSATLPAGSSSVLMRPQGGLIASRCHVAE